jgi:uncharacterized protein (TIGR02246 family)
MGKIRVAAFVVSTMAITGLFMDYWAIASTASEKAEIVALNQKLITALDQKELDASMAYFSDAPDALFYENDVFEVKGRAALRKYLMTIFSSASHIQQELGPITVAVSGDLAAAHYTLNIKWTDKNGDHSARSRYTQVLKKANGRWLIWHEHLSVPFDPATGKAILEAKP